MASCAGRSARRQPPEGLPAPQLPELAGVHGIVIAGIGGTGVVTVSAVLGMAAHLDGRFAATIDQTGLAQKFGAVMSYVRIAGSRRCHSRAAHPGRATRTC